MYDGLALLEALYPPPTARRTPQCVERSDQIRGTEATRDPRQLKGLVTGSQGHGVHPAAASRRKTLGKKFRANTRQERACYLLDCPWGLRTFLSRFPGCGARLRFPQLTSITSRREVALSSAAAVLVCGRTRGSASAGTNAPGGNAAANRYRVVGNVGAPRPAEADQRRTGNRGAS